MRECRASGIVVLYNVPKDTIPPNKSGRLLKPE